MAMLAVPSWVEGLSGGSASKKAASPAPGELPAATAEGQPGASAAGLGGGAAAELRALGSGEAQLRALASNPDFFVDEGQLFELLAAAHQQVADLERSPPHDARGLSEAQQLARGALGLCAAWLRLAAAGGLVESLEGLRGPAAAEMAFATAAAAVCSETGLGPAMLVAFNELGGVGLMGSALQGVDESALASCTRRLRSVTLRCCAQARREGSAASEALAAGVEGFRAGLFARFRELAGRPGRRMRTSQFRELVADLCAVLGGVYGGTQAFEMGCLLSLQLSMELSASCEGVPGGDASEAVEWMASVMRALLDQGSTSGALASPVAVREWVEDSGLWNALLWRAGCETQQHAHHVMSVLLTRHAATADDLVGQLALLGALSRSPVPPPSRLSMQGALLSAASSAGVEATLDLIAGLCNALGFQHLAEEGIDLLARATQRALAAGYDPGGHGGAAAEARGLPRSLALSYLVHFMQWACRSDDPPEGPLAHARSTILHTLALHPALAPLLPAAAAEALQLAAAPPAGCHREGMEGCVRALCALSVDLASAGASAACAGPEGAAKASAAAVAALCGALPAVGAEAPFGAPSAQVWVAALVGALACHLRVPGAQIATPQVGSLWSRMIVRPVFGVPLPASSMQYFKLAFLAQPLARSALLAPLAAAPSPPPELSLAYASIFCPASFDDDLPPLSVEFFFPERRAPRPQGAGGADAATGGGHDPDRAARALQFGDSPPRLPQPLRRSISSTADFPELDLLVEGQCDEAALAAAAAAVGVVLPSASTAAPRLRLDRVRAVMSEQSAPLFNELTVYEAIERRLWDEFDERGRVEDPDATRQRDAAAARCLVALDREIDTAGFAGRELAPPLTEARAKFSSLCELIAGGAAEGTARTLRECEEAFAKAEDRYLAAGVVHKRLAARCRRRGEPPPPCMELTLAKQGLARAHAALIAELRHLAARAQLGLVEVVGLDGLARSLRAVGGSHADPLLESLQRHSRWSSAQGEADCQVEDVPDATRAAAQDAALPRRERAPTDAQLARPHGLATYDGTRELLRGRTKIFAARRDGTPVALKVYTDADAEAYQAELAALKELYGPGVVPLQGAFQSESGSLLYLELGWCAGGTLQGWCEQHRGAVDAEDPEAFVLGLGLFRQVWQALDYVHLRGAAHGNVALASVLLTVDHRPVLAGFSRCAIGGSLSSAARAWPPEADYAAPEVQLPDESGELPLPTQPADVYAAGVMMAKAFLGLQVQVSACPVHPTTGLRRLPDGRTDADLADLIQLAVAQAPQARPTAAAAAAHRALEPASFLRRRGMLGTGARGRTAAESLLSAAEQLREDYRGRRVDDPLLFSRDAVFEAISSSRVGEWGEEALLGEWRVMLNNESGVDGGGLRREVVSLFFEQLEQSGLVQHVCAEGAPPTLFIADRQASGKSVQQWRQTWAAVGAMILRSISHFGNAPAAFSSAVFDCALGRIGKLPPDDSTDGADDQDGLVKRLAQLREARGDEWARSELLDLLRRLRQADAQKEASYRWMLAQRAPSPGRPAGSGSPAEQCTIPLHVLETMSAMLEPPTYQFLFCHSRIGADGTAAHAGAVLEWALLWDIYLRYLGSGDRWLAYEALLDGLTARGNRRDMWACATGAQIVEVLEGAALSPDVVVANLEFKPSYGYDQQIQGFRRVIEGFSPDELSMFLRFATGIGKLPASKKFPAGQKLTIRFMPERLDHLPSAHTCFWVVDLPPYEDVGEMAAKLRQAIAAPQPFAMS
ncbi:unnamed protein product [Prorocentrum cordatum]|uniref:HECT-type E3 ubiquitin transferase n=1 Tax=Prorocentrum cordatum TaxID=2364126 RepID=A0ABN9QK21_9DINO|nr:unnamed protein product [Polarella glacialis]